MRSKKAQGIAIGPLITGIVLVVVLAVGSMFLFGGVEGAGKETENITEAAVGEEKISKFEEKYEISAETLGDIEHGWCCNEEGGWERIGVEGATHHETAAGEQKLCEHDGIKRNCQERCEDANFVKGEEIVEDGSTELCNQLHYCKCSGRVIKTIDEEEEIVLDLKVNKWCCEEFHGYGTWIPFYLKYSGVTRHHAIPIGEKQSECAMTGYNCSERCILEGFKEGKEIIEDSVTCCMVALEIVRKPCADAADCPEGWICNDDNECVQEGKEDKVRIIYEWEHVSNCEEVAKWCCVDENGGYSMEDVDCDRHGKDLWYCYDEETEAYAWVENEVDCDNPVEIRVTGDEYCAEAGAYCKADEKEVKQSKMGGTGEDGICSDTRYCQCSGVPARLCCDDNRWISYYTRYADTKHHAVLPELRQALCGEEESTTCDTECKSGGYDYGIEIGIDGKEGGCDSSRFCQCRDSVSTENDWWCCLADNAIEKEEWIPFILRKTYANLGEEHPKVSYDQRVCRTEGLTCDEQCKTAGEVEGETWTGVEAGHREEKWCCETRTATVGRENCGWIKLETAPEGTYHFVQRGDGAYKKGVCNWDDKHRTCQKLCEDQGYNTGEESVDDGYMGVCDNYRHCRCYNSNSLNAGQCTQTRRCDCRTETGELKEAFCCDIEKGPNWVEYDQTAWSQNHHGNPSNRQAFCTTGGETCQDKCLWLADEYGLNYKSGIEVGATDTGACSMGKHCECSDKLPPVQYYCCKTGGDFFDATYAWKKSWCYPYTEHHCNPSCSEKCTLEDYFGGKMTGGTWGYKCECITESDLPDFSEQGCQHYCCAAEGVYRGQWVTSQPECIRLLGMGANFAIDPLRCSYENHGCDQICDEGERTFETLLGEYSGEDRYCCQCNTNIEEWCCDNGQWVAYDEKTGETMHSTAGSYVKDLYGIRGQLRCSNDINDLTTLTCQEKCREQGFLTGVDDAGTSGESDKCSSSLIYEDKAPHWRCRCLNEIGPLELGERFTASGVGKTAPDEWCADYNENTWTALAVPGDEEHLYDSNLLGRHCREQCYVKGYATGEEIPSQAYGLVDCDSNHCCNCGEEALEEWEYYCCFDWRSEGGGILETVAEWCMPGDYFRWGEYCTIINGIQNYDCTAHCNRLDKDFKSLSNNKLKCTCIDRPTVRVPENPPYYENWQCCDDTGWHVFGAGGDAGVAGGLTDVTGGTTGDTGTGGTTGDTTTGGTTVGDIIVSPALTFVTASGRSSGGGTLQHHAVFEEQQVCAGDPDGLTCEEECRALQDTRFYMNGTEVGANGYDGACDGERHCRCWTEGASPYTRFTAIELFCCDAETYGGKNPTWHTQNEILTPGMVLPQYSCSIEENIKCTPQTCRVACGMSGYWYGYYDGTVGGKGLKPQDDAYRCYCTNAERKAAGGGAGMDLTAGDGADIAIITTPTDKEIEAAGVTGIPTDGGTDLTAGGGADKKFFKCSRKGSTMYEWKEAAGLSDGEKRISNCGSCSSKCEEEGYDTGEETVQNTCRCYNYATGDTSSVTGGGPDTGGDAGGVTSEDTEASLFDDIFEWVGDLFT